MQTFDIRLSERVTRMEESATIKTAQLARDLAAQGHPIINLSLGEPDFDTPDHIKDAAKIALDEGKTKYPPVPGIPALRQAICDKFARDNQLHFSPDQIVVSNGAKQCIANLSMALLNPGDEVIILAPYWVSYVEIVKLGGGVPVVLTADVEQDYKVSAEQVAQAITPKTRMLLFSSPCNPTGSVYSREELAEIAKIVVSQSDAIIVSDEIYEYITFSGDHVSIAEFPEVADRTVVVNGFSKGFAMTGWRLGYLAAPQSIAEACAKVQGQFTSGANTFGQHAAVVALNSSLAPTLEMKQAYRIRRDKVFKELQEIDGLKVNLPAGAFYFFPDIRAFFGKSDGEKRIENSEDFCTYLLYKAHLATVPGEAFGAPHCFRFSFAASEESLMEAMQRMKQALSVLS